jgi:hypothetical protein
MTPTPAACCISARIVRPDVQPVVFFRRKANFFLLPIRFILLARRTSGWFLALRSVFKPFEHWLVYRGLETTRRFGYEFKESGVIGDELPSQHSSKPLKPAITGNARHYLVEAPVVGVNGRAR